MKKKYRIVIEDLNEERHQFFIEVDRFSEILPLTIKTCKEKYLIPILILEAVFIER